MLNDYYGKREIYYFDTFITAIFYSTSEKYLYQQICYPLIIGWKFAILVIIVSYKAQYS